METRFETIVVGAGYAGVICAARLAVCGVKVAIIAPKVHFVEKIRMHEGLTTSIEAPGKKLDLRSSLTRAGVRFMEGSVVSIDRSTRNVLYETTNGSARVSYDRVVIACGSEPAGAAVPGVTEHAYRMQTEGPRGTMALRAALQRLPSDGRRFVVVGGGATGIEVAGELASFDGAKVTIMCAGTFAAFARPRVATALRREAAKLGIEIVERTPVSAVGPDHVAFAGGLLPCDLCVWCGGVRIPSFVAEAGVAHTDQGRILVDPWLRSLTDPRLYAVGDACLTQHQSGAPPRISAFFALASGAFAAKTIAAERRHRQIRGFTLATYGQGIQVGRGGAGFASYPFDRQIGPVYTGPLAYHMRRFFVSVLFAIVKLELRRFAVPFKPPVPGIRAARMPPPHRVRA
ncbi:MAG: FAD-dependent oxidoreductase [Alphaproteobacteria bacterium]|nr:FAD-dependent oxidoreductase [Alphaproteobacteria bacterium]